MDFFRIAFISLTAFGAGAAAIDLYGVLRRAAKRKAACAGKAIPVIRNAAYFSLGAGPAGRIALARGEGLTESLLWAAISGCLIALLARVLLRPPSKA